MNFLNKIAVVLIVISCGCREDATRHQSVPSPAWGECFDIHRAHVVSVYDGDTATLDFKLGLDVDLDNQKTRFAGIDAPELSGTERPAGLRARNFLDSLIAGKDVIAQTGKDRKDKYGRWLVVIYVQTDSALVNVNELMIKSGNASVYSSRAMKND